MKATWLIAVLIIAAWLWVFRAPLFLGEVCALRDAGNFYYPLFAWESKEWGAGRIPLWNPYDGLGVPVLADATSSVLYPGKLIFALPVSFALRFTLYVAGHVLFAAAAVYFVARQWKASAWGAGVAAMSYAFGGYVLFQHCNLVYLVSAAWLPLGIWLAEEMLARRSLARAIGFGAVLAIMTLGGDPQTACHTGLLACVYAVVLFFTDRRALQQADSQVLPSTKPSTVVRKIPRTLLLGLSATAAFGLAAVQILPTWEWTRHSDRASFEAPRSIYEVAGSLLSRDANKGALKGSVWTQVFGRHRSNSHAARTYQYSLGPWRLTEVLWPNISGRMYPAHRRWMSEMPGEKTVWTPSLYMGCIPLLAVVAAWLLASSPRDRWLKTMIVVGVLGSFGWYGFGWVWHELRLAVTGDPAAPTTIGQPVGGLYWLLVAVVPGYAYFRYPAKWFVMAAIGCSLLAARGVDAIHFEETRLRRLPKYLCLFNVICLIGLLLGRGQLVAWFQRVSPSELYGPIDASGAWSDIVCGMLLVAAESGFLWASLRSTYLRKRVPIGGSLFVLTCLDLVLANQWLVASVPGQVFERSPPIRAQIRNEHDDRFKTPPRVLHSRTVFQFPSHWKEQSDNHRLAEIVTWERDSLVHRHHLGFGVAVLDAPTTIRSAEWLTFLQEVPRNPSYVSRSPGKPDFNWLGLNYWMDRPAGKGFNRSIELIENSAEWPRAWLTVADATASPEVLPANSKCDIIRYGPHCVEVEVSLNGPATLVLSDAFDPNWTAIRRTRGSTQETQIIIEKFHGLVRGVPLPAGDHVVAFEFKARSLFVGAAISLLSLVVIAVQWFVLKPAQLHQLPNPDT